MKMIIGVLLLGLVACAFGAAAAPKLPEGCEDVHNKALSPFNFDEFFKGQWYLTHGKTVTDQNDCVTFSVTGTDAYFTTVKTSIVCNLEKVSNATFTKLHCVFPDKTYTSYLSVLATDYNNYALVYRCGSLTGTTSEANYLVGQRKKTTTFPSGITDSTLTSKGLKQSDFKSYNC